MINFTCVLYYVSYLHNVAVTSKFILGMKFGVLQGEMSEESDIFIKSTQDFFKYSAKVAQEPPVLRNFVETKTWKAALKAQEEMIKMGTKVRSYTKS